jgi:16S rRNA G966 N2-methylase RsmD
VLEAIAHYQLLHPDGELAVEHNPEFWQPQPLPSLEVCRQKIYGSTALAFYTVMSNED